MNVNVKRGLVTLFFIMYFFVGIMIYDDYGISTDEPPERKTALLNAKYVLNTFGYDGLSEMEENLSDYLDKYYGVFLQLPCVVVEWITGFKDNPSIYLYRHLYVFMICFWGYGSFYLLCKRLTKSYLLSLLAVFMVAFYPRFFANQFYDIKDIVFASMYMVSMWATIEAITRKLVTWWLIVFSVVTAIATNVRIIGIIFPLLLIGYILLTWIMKKCKKDILDKCEHPFRSIIVILFVYLGSYIAMMPVIWDNPINGMIDIFKKFSQYDDWNGHVVFMGELVRGSAVPWYYIPLWMLISVPIWYWILLMFVIVASGYTAFICIRIHRKITWQVIFKYKYLIWICFLSVGPWLATVVFHSTLYNSWRHCFFLLPAIVLMIVYGLALIREKMKFKRLNRSLLICFVVMGMLSQVTWIVRNHPYQMVYLNPIGRIWGDQFDRDYWCLATTDMCRYVLKNDSDEKISINAAFNTFERLLTDEEKARIVVEENSTYWLESFRKIIGNDYVRKGYEEIYAIKVDGYKIGSVQKKVEIENE